MNLRNVFLVLLMIFLTSSTIFGEGKKDTYFSYSITQKDKDIAKQDDTYFIDKDTFEINIKLNMNTGIYINISEYPTMYNRAKSGFDFAKLLSTDGAWMGGAEHNNNKDKNIFLQGDENRWQYWFISDNASRFNSIEKDGDLYIGKRIIENIYYTYYRADEKTLNIKDTDISKLYITITYVTHDSSYTTFKEHKTESFILVLN
ncbi:MAG: hypothetical protein J5631_09755 [Spirochaetaceae bacterium]|nr:hypothetical protein [Spirochaetaceae bacterium]